MVLVHGTLYVRAAFIDGQSRDGVSMVFAHTNSMGVTYFLNQKTVDLRGRSTQSIYYFSKDRRPETIERLPEGFSVNETRGAVSSRFAGRTDGLSLRPLTRPKRRRLASSRPTSRGSVACFRSQTPSLTPPVREASLSSNPLCSVRRSRVFSPGFR